MDDLIKRYKAYVEALSDATYAVETLNKIWPNHDVTIEINHKLRAESMHLVTFLAETARANDRLATHIYNALGQYAWSDPSGAANIRPLLQLEFYFEHYTKPLPEDTGKLSTEVMAAADALELDRQGKLG